MHRRLLVNACLACSAITAPFVSAQDWPSLVVTLHNGRILKGILSPETNAHRLWLSFGNPGTQVRRGTAWNQVRGMTQAGEPFSRDQAISLADGKRDVTIPRVTNIEVPTSARDDDAVLQELPMRPATNELRPVVIPDFSVSLGNWDDDTPTDGLQVQIFNAQRTEGFQRFDGTLTVELFSTYRIETDEAPHSRGSSLRSVGRWTVAVHQDGDSAEVTLPFQASHPELDTRWSPYGLVHFEWVVPGHRVVQRSVDGVRIRPWAPLRDELERKDWPRFMASEWR